MEYVIYTPKNVGTKKAGQSTILLRRTSGNTISHGAVEALELKEGDKIGILHDKKNKEWYIIRHDEGFELKTSPSDSKKTKALRFSSSAMTNIILDSVGFTEMKSASMRLATEPTELKDILGFDKSLKGYAIITSSAKK